MEITSKKVFLTKFKIQLNQTQGVIEKSSRRKNILIVT